MTLKIAGKDYTLSPALECLKKIQHHFQKDILKVMEECPNMRFDDHAKIIEIAIDDFGVTPPKLSDIEQWILDDCGITAIRQIIQGWLVIITSPKAEREAVTKTVGELLKAQGI
jgi:hypothetical protein